MTRHSSLISSDRQLSILCVDARDVTVLLAIFFHVVVASSAINITLVNVLRVFLRFLFRHKVKAFLDNEAKGTKIIGATSMEDMVSKLKSPRRVMLLVKGKSLDLYW
jgi:hypothetical protein